MQRTILALFATAAFALIGASGALAAPANGSVGELGNRTDQTIQVRGGCGRSMHRNSEGMCRAGCGRGWHFSSEAGHCITGQPITQHGGS